MKYKTKEDQEDPNVFNPWRHYFSIAAGLLLSVLAIGRLTDGSLSYGLLKLAFGIALIGFGIFKLIKRD